MMVKFGSTDIIIGECNEEYFGLNTMKVRIPEDKKSAQIYLCLINRERRLVQIWANVYEVDGKTLSDEKIYAQAFRPHECWFKDINLEELLDIAFE